MSNRFLVSLSRSGSQSQLTMAEYTKDRKVLYRITYPLTYTEACNLGEWATSRNLRHLCDTFLTATGWDIWLPIGKVINPDVPFFPLHSSSRRKPISDLERDYIVNGHYSHTYHTA